ncbi:MAG: hypothetical protein HY855_19815 [Burkholderiales bacterium]|nr:hypothetical protein [Burkholderiales bacterium]
MSFILGLTAMLAACGGGGSSTGDTPGGQGGPLSLNATNYTLAVQEALASASFVSDTGSLAVAADAQPSAQGAWFAQVLGQLRKAPGWLANMPVLVTGATQSVTQRCPGGGTLAIESNDANGNRIVDAGDSASITATACTIDGETISGRMAMTFTSVTGDPSTSSVFSLAATVSLTDFSARDSSGATTGNGSMSVNMASTGLNAATVTVVATSLSIRASYGSTQYTRSMTNFTVREVLTPVGSGYRSALTIDGSLSSSALGSSSITVSTVNPIVQTSTQVAPASGQVLISGANGSKVRATVVAGGSVQIELDADGNGSYESSTTKLWRDLV